MEIEAFKKKMDEFMIPSDPQLLVGIMFEIMMMRQFIAIIHLHLDLNNILYMH